MSLLLTSAIGVALASGAHAQEAAGAAGSGYTELGDVVVTARRVEERLQDVPVSVTVFSQEQLDKRNVATAQDLVTYTPSLSASGQFGSNNTTFTLRGFVQEIGTSPTVGIHFADVVAPRGGLSALVAGDSLPTGSFYDLQNIQVLKGPQGTLFGRNTTGGAILVVPRKPTDAFGGYLEGSAGNYDMLRVQGALNVPLSDSARFRVAFDRQVRDGYIKNTGLSAAGTRIGPKDWSDIDYAAVRASLDLDLGDSLENYTVFTYNRSRTAGDQMSLYSCDPTNRFGNPSCVQLQRQAAQGATGFYTGQTSVDMRNNLTVWQAINTTTWRPTTSMTITNIFSYGELKNDVQTGLFGSL
jgi:iron complex outermembrane receptor protein